MGKFLDEIVGESVGTNKVQIAVVVVVEELESPAAHPARRHADALGHGDIFKGRIAVVLIEGKNLLVDVGDEQIHPAVLIEVGGVHTHSGTGATFGTVGNVGGEPGFFEAAAAAIQK